ncbi:MAG: hypothetical protein ABSG69_10730 [Candidatus Acidiferrum sp.]|jgi:hypothetical protein
MMVKFRMLVPAHLLKFRRGFEKRLELGLKLDFDQIMLDIDAIRAEVPEAREESIV